MKVKEMCLCALFALLIAVGAFIKVPVSIVPITLQTLFVVMAGLILKEKAVYSVLLYVGMGLIGLPVFASGSGISYVLVPSFGFLLGFIICSYYIGRVKSDNYKIIFIHCCIGMLLIYLMGMGYFIFIQYVYYQQVFSLSWVFTSLFLVYLPGDLLSIIVAEGIYLRLRHSKVLN